MPLSKDKLSLKVSDPKQSLPDKREALGYMDVIGDAFHIDNPISALGKLIGSPESDVNLENGFNPIERAEADGIPLEYMDTFAYVDNESEYKNQKEMIAKDMQARQNLADAGFDGFLASMTAGIVSPSTFLGGAGAVRAIGKGVSAFRAGATTAATVAGTVLAEEKLLQATQTGRTDREVWINTLAAGTLAGVLSGTGTAISRSLESKMASDIKANMEIKSKVYEGGLPQTFGEMLEHNQSLSAAKAGFTKDQLGIAKPDSKVAGAILDGYLKVNKQFNPTVRMMSSASKKVRETFLTLADTSIKPQLVKEGGVLEASVETVLRRRHGDFAQNVVSFGEIWKKYLKERKPGETSYNFMRFREEVGKAVRRDAPHKNKHVAEAVEIWKKYYDDLAEELITIGKLPEGISSPKDGARFLNRVYKTKNIKDDVKKWKETIEPWYRKQLLSIKTKLEKQAAEVGKNGKPTPDAIKAREDLGAHFEEGDIFEDYLNDSINSVTNNIIGAKNEAGFAPTVAGKAGPLKQRAFNIPDEIIEDYLDSDVLYLADRYTKQVAPQIELHNRFGDEGISKIRDDIVAEYDEIIERSPGESHKLLKERKEVLQDIDTIWNLLQGTYKGFGGDPDGLIKRGSEAFMTFNYATKLGSVVPSSMSDSAMGILRRGFGNFFGQSMKPFLKNIRPLGENLSKTEAKSYGKALEYAASIRSQTLYSIGDPMAFGTPFERALGVMGNKMSNINLINQWNDVWQTVATIGTRFRLVENINSIAAGKNIVKREREFMNFVGISDADMKQMGKLVEKFGEETTDGAIIPHIEKWPSSASRLSNKFKDAINKEVDRTVIVKGVADIPRFGNTLLGRIMFQWQNFNFAFNNKVLISGMQDADGRVLAGFSSLIVLGMMTEMIKSAQTGQSLPEDPIMWLEAGLNRSGFLGLLSYGNSFSEAAFGKGYKQLLGEEARPGAGVGSFVETMMGPTGNTFRKIQQFGVATFKDEYIKSDIHTLRTLTPGQNLFYMQYLFDQAEEKLASGLRTRRKPKKRKKKRRTKNNR